MLNTFKTKSEKKFLISSAIFAATTFFSFTTATSIGDIDLVFCNQETETGTVKNMPKTLQLELDEGQAGNICMQIINKSNQDVRINFGFVDGTISNDFDQKKVCKNEGDAQNFGKFVTINNTSIIVPADGSATKNAKIQFPVGYGGMVHGCVTYYITSTDSIEQGSSSFDILVRKANFVDVLVNGEFDLGLIFVDVPQESGLNRRFFNIVENTKIKIYREQLEKKLSVQVGLRNTGRITQDVKIAGTISNFLGYKQEFQTGAKRVIGQDEVIIVNLIENLPFYKGPFDIRYEVSYTPNFEFETNKISADMKETKIIKQEATIFIIPRLIIRAIIGAIIIIIVIIQLKKGSKTKNMNRKSKDPNSFYLSYENKLMPTKKAPAKKAPAKKVVAKKAPAKKVVAKKAPAKKVVAKKAPAKKVVAKKAPAKKVVAKKAPAKKVVAKKK